MRIKIVLVAINKIACCQILVGLAAQLFRLVDEQDVFCFGGYLSVFFCYVARFMCLTTEYSSASAICSYARHFDLSNMFSLTLRMLM